MSDQEKRQVFATHFLHEQSHVVGPSLQAAVDKFDWPLVREIALRPLIRFAFFRDREFFWFRNFARREDRIEKGLRAFEIATSVGWDHVESALRDYDILPSAFFADSVQYFTDLRAGLRPA